MAREPIAVDLLPMQYFVPAGGSLATGVTGMPGQEHVILQYLSGGTCAIVHLTAGIGFSNGFVLPATPVSLACSGTFWLMAAGATALVQVLRSRSQGFEGATLGYNGGV